MSKQQILEWMNILEMLIQNHHYSPGLIFNFDETFLETTPNKLKIILPSSYKKPAVPIPPKSKHMTIGVCIAADGGKPTPVLVLPRKTIPSLPQQALEFYCITGQSSGWITGEIFHSWVKEVFIPYIEEKRKKLMAPNARALLIIDGHSSHSEPKAIELFRNHGVDVLVLPSHSSAILQPLDLCCFRVFKHNLRDQMKSWSSDPPDIRLQKLIVGSIFALDSATTMLNIMNSFNRSGIWPFNKEAPLNSSLVASALDNIPTTPKKKRVAISGNLLTKGVPRSF